MPIVIQILGCSCGVEICKYLTLLSVETANMMIVEMERNIAAFRSCEKIEGNIIICEYFFLLVLYLHLQKHSFKPMKAHVRSSFFNNFLYSLLRKFMLTGDIFFVRMIVT